MMKSYDAVEDSNFDGGGSSTLMIRNNVEEGSVSDRFEVLNTLSDGDLRSFSNSFLVVKGELAEKPLDIRGVGLRKKFDTPNNIYLDQDGNLNFDPVENANYYEILVNNIKIETTKNKIPLRGLVYGDNVIKVRAKGTRDYSISEYSVEINYKIYSGEVDYLLKLLKKFIKR